MPIDVNFITGNLGQAIHTEDLLEYLREGLASTGLKVGYSREEYLCRGINILLENPFENVYDQLFGIRKAYPQSRLYMVVTELLTPTGFNSSNFNKGEQPATTSHYDDRAYWIDRTKEFMRFVPVVDGLIMVGLERVNGRLPAGYERGVDSYFGLGKPVHLVPLCPSPSQPCAITEGSYRDKDIDILFTGTITPYRKKVLNQLRARNFKVVDLEAHMPGYLRNNYVSRSKLSVGLKLSEDTEILSTMRAHYHLANRVPHVFERTAIQSPLDPFLNIFDSGEAFIEACARLLSGADEFPVRCFSEFHNSKKSHYARSFSELRSSLEH